MVSSKSWNFSVALAEGCRNALEGKGPQRRPQERLDRRLEEVAKAVGGDYCRLQMPLTLALAFRGTVAWHRLGAQEGEGGYTQVTQGGVTPPPLPMCQTPLSLHPWGGGTMCAHWTLPSVLP